MRNTRSCNYFHDHHASDNNWSRPIIITRTRNTETHVKQKFFNFKNTQLLRHYYFLLAHCASVTFARSLSTRLLSRHFENSSFLSTWRSCALNARISKQSISTIYICWKFFNKRATDLRERVAHFFFFFFFSRRRKKKKEYRPTSIVHAEQQLISRFLDSVYVIISITPREMLLQHRNSMLFDRFIALSLLDSCQKKKREKERKRNERGSNRLRSISSMQCCNELIFDDGNGCRLIRSTEQPL